VVAVLQQLKKEKKFLIFLFLFSLGIRFLVFGLFLSKNKNYWSSDSFVYHDVAVQITEGKGIYNHDGSPTFYRVPGYSFFLATCYKILGEDIKMALWVQAFFASFIPILIFLISLIFFPANLLLAKISSIYSAFHLGFIVFSGMAMAETFFSFFFFLFLILFFSCFNSCRYKLFLAGFFLGLASLVRPVGHYLIFLSLLILIFSSVGFLNKIKNSLLLFAGWLLVVFGWLLRNYLLTGFIFFHTLPGVHFLKHSAGRVAMYVYNCSYMGALTALHEEVEVLTKEKEKDLNRKINEIEFCHITEKVAFKYLVDNPFLTIKHAFINMFKTCFSLYSAELLYIDSGGKLPDYNKNRGWLDILKRFLVPQVTSNFLALIIYLEIIFFLFILIGFGGFVLKALFIKDYFYLLCKILPFIFLFVFISLSCGFARLRLPIEPFLIILSFKFWLEVLRRKRVVL